MPENLGLTIDAELGNLITSVREDSPAAQSGLREGDVISVIDGQVIYSLADFQFVLHHKSDQATLDTTLVRDEKVEQHTIELPNGWRETDRSWRASMYNMPPRPALWVETLRADHKRSQGIAADKLALRVRDLWGPAVRRSGLEKEDVIIRFGDRNEHMTDGQFHAALRLDYYQPGAVLQLRVLRGSSQKGLNRPISC